MPPDINSEGLKSHSQVEKQQLSSHWWWGWESECKLLVREAFASAVALASLGVGYRQKSQNTKR